MQIESQSSNVYRATRILETLHSSVHIREQQRTASVGWNIRLTRVKEEERMGDVLASEGFEGRGKLR